MLTGEDICGGGQPHYSPEHCRAQPDCVLPHRRPMYSNFVTQNSRLETFLNKLSDTFEKMRRIESRVANDEDLKLSDTLRYHMRDTSAAKDLLYRRLRCEVLLLH